MNTICDIKKEDQGATWTTMNHRKWLTAQYSYKVYIELLQYLKNSIKLNFNEKYANFAYLTIIRIKFLLTF